MTLRRCPAWRAPSCTRRRARYWIALVGELGRGGQADDAGLRRRGRRAAPACRRAASPAAASCSLGRRVLARSHEHAAAARIEVPGKSAGAHRPCATHLRISAECKPQLFFWISGLGSDGPIIHCPGRSLAQSKGTRLRIGPAPGPIRWRWLCRQNAPAHAMIHLTTRIRDGRVPSTGTGMCLATCVEES